MGFGCARPHRLVDGLFGDALRVEAGEIEVVSRVIAGSGAVGAARGHAQPGLARSEVAPVAVGGRGRGGRRSRGVKAGADDLRGATGGQDRFERLGARGDIDFSGGVGEPARFGILERARAWARYSRCTGETRAISTASSASRFSAIAPESLPVTEPRRRPTHTVAVMSRSSDRPLVVMRLSAKRACDSTELCRETAASSAPAVLACASTVSQIFNASSRVSITGRCKREGYQPASRVGQTHRPRQRSGRSRRWGYIPSKAAVFKTVT